MAQCFFLVKVFEKLSETNLIKCTSLYGFRNTGVWGGTPQKTLSPRRAAEGGEEGAA